MAPERSTPILIVDDYKAIPRIIRGLPHQLDSANINEAFALAKLREKPYEFVISDWNMQPTTGLDPLREIRADSRRKHLPFTIVTTGSRTENVLAACETNVSNEALRAKITGVPDGA